MDHLESMRVFIRVAGLGSFTRAAMELDISKAIVTRRIAELESHLCARLLNRTTRSVSLTESGPLYYERARKIVEQVENAQELVADSSSVPTGTLRIVAPVVFAQRRLTPALRIYRQRYPKVVPELMLTNQNFDLISHGYDLGIVPASSVCTSSTLIARPLVSTTLMVCAAPGYLARHGVPSHLGQLAHHAAPGHASGNGRGFPAIIPSEPGH